MSVHNSPYTIHYDLGIFATQAYSAALTEADRFEAADSAAEMFEIAAAKAERGDYTRFEAANDRARFWRQRAALHLISVNGEQAVAK